MTKLTRLKPTESQIQESILQWLQYDRKAYVIRINSGKVRVHHNYTKKSGEKVNRYSMVKLAPEGTPDIVGCYDGIFFAIEVKKPGKKPRPEQLQHIEDIQKTGGIAFWASDFNEAKDTLLLEVKKKKHPLMRIDTVTGKIVKI